MCDKLKITSWKTLIKSAFIQACSSALLCVIYTFVILLLTDGEEFVGKHASYEVINGIRHDVALIICTCLAALIPIILFRYESENNMAFYVILSSVFYLTIIFITIFLWLDSSFDFVMYAICSVPIGSMVGTLIAIIINGLRNSSLK